MRNLLLMMFIALFCRSVGALEVPKLKGHVNDYGNFLTPAEEQKIEQQLKDHEKETSNQIVLLTVPSLGGEVIEEFSIKVGNTWKLGHKGKDNGVLILIAVEEHKMRIETGFGMEGPLPDSLCGTIMRKYMTPAFRANENAKGVTDAITKITEAVKGEFTVEDSSPGGSEENKEKCILFFIILLVVCGFLGAIHPAIGGTVGGIGGFIIGAVFSGWSLAIILSIVGALIGTIAVYILEGLAEGSSSGSSGGGSWSSGGGGGGGFSGFGGGFGGGGASGSW